MNIQSLSISIPGGCPNSCRFCVSKTHTETKYKRKDDIYEFQDRLQHARDVGCNTVVLTGEGEPIFNMPYIVAFYNRNRIIRKPFINIEVQTSGVGLNEKALIKLKECGIKTISLSLSYLFDDEINADINRTPSDMKVDIKDTCRRIKEAGFNLRLSLNMTDAYDTCGIDIFDKARELNVDQITFRKLYQSEDKDHPVNQWIKKHSVYPDFWRELSLFIRTHGNKLERLPFGAIKYSVFGISTVIDDDCMSKDNEGAMKYMILRENCKLYSRWDDTGSLIF